YIDSCSPTIQNTTVINNASYGIHVTGPASPTIANDTISNNPVGILINSPATPTLTTLTISNNAGFPIVIDAKTTLPSVSGITLTGNGTNGVQLVGNVDVNTTWKNFGAVYYPSSYVYVSGTSTPILTLEPGITVKFPNSNSFIIGSGQPGNLQAVGTSTSLITLTPKSPSPAPASWQAIRF